MPTQAPWLQHPRAVAQNFFVTRKYPGAFQCKTNRGKLEIWHRSPEYMSETDCKKLVCTFSPADMGGTKLIELARQDPRHAIANHLGITLDELIAEGRSATPRNVSPVPRGSFGSRI